MADNAEDAAEKKVDEGWKRKASEEKEALEKKGRASEPAQESAGGDAAGETTEEGGAGGEGALPAPTFAGLVSGLAAQAFAFLGLIGGEQDVAPEKDLDSARHILDTLAMLEEKTKGNLTDEESALLEGLLYNLRIAYVRESQTS